MKIDTRLSDRIKKVHASPTLAITSKAKKLKSEGKDVVSFAAGEPDFDTPDLIKEAAVEAIMSGFTKYTPTTGIPELKQAICSKFKRDNNLSYGPKQIVVSCGAKHSIFNAMFVLLDPGDEVIIPSPFWVSYPEMVRLAEADPRIVKTDSSTGFKLTPEALLTHITPKTRILILNSPSNPTGCVYTEKELEEIARICVAKKIFCISDEIYEKITFDGKKHVSIGALGNDIFDLTITINGVSKSHSMTGWRIGYLGAPEDVAEAVSNLQDHSTSNPASICQKAALAALNMPETFSRDMCAEFQKRRDYIVKRIQRMAGISCVVPGGAFYIFCDISKTRLDSLTFSSRFLDEKLTAVIPGVAFGDDSFIRMSYATSLGQIEKGMDRLEMFLKELK